MPDQPPHDYIPAGPLDEPPFGGFCPDEVRAAAFAAVLAGVPLGAYDQRMIARTIELEDDNGLRWLMSLLWRCRLAGRAEAAQSPEGTETEVAHYKRLFALQQQARDLGRSIITGGSGWRGSYYGAVTATYPQGSRIANRDSWHCHHDHPDDLSALECALGEVRRLAGGRTYEPCSAGPDCRDENCRRRWARLNRGPKPPEQEDGNDG